MAGQSVENLVFISAATRYNTERRPLLRGYTDQALQSGVMFENIVSEKSIREYGESQDLDSENPEKSFHQLLLAYPDDADIQHYQMYLSIRYADLSKQIRSELGFSAVDLVSFEAFIYNQITERAENLGIETTFYEFSDKEEYIQTNEFEEPSKLFQNRWQSCIAFSRSELIDSFLTETENQSLAQSQSYTERISTVNAMINFLSVQYRSDSQYSKYQFFNAPLFEIPGEENRILVPFPAVLVSTAQVRIEKIFQNYEDLRNAEDRKKGDLVEELALDALNEFDCRNLIHSFKYTDPHPRETDGLLLLEDSYWTVEVKSHPIFRKLPSRSSTALDRFKEKAGHAISQGENTIEFLQEDGQDILYHLAGDKSHREKEYGVIVVLDGLLPTLFTQNQQVDELFGMEDIYQEVDKGDRVLLITLFDLFELTHQVDELDQLEEFLLWRTDFGYDMPVAAFNEREYWAMYFDAYSVDKDFQKVVDEASKDDITIPYISERFNDKPHIPGEGF